MSGGKGCQGAHQAIRIIVLFLFMSVVHGTSFSPALVFAQQGSVDKLKQTADEKKATVERLKREIEIYEQSIRLRRSQAASLANQIAILNEEIQKLELSIKLTSDEIGLAREGIRSTEKKIAVHKQTLIVKRMELARALRNLNALGSEGGLFVLLAHDTVSEYFNDVQHVEQLQSSIASIVVEVEHEKTQAEEKREDLKGKEKELTALQRKLDGEQERISGQRTVKAQLLVDTRRSENRFQLELDEARREQRSIEAEVVSLEKKLRDEIAKGDRKKKLEALGSPDFQWPVKGVITAYFHDPDYPYRYVFEHPAVDIAARQGTPVRASTSGYVAIAKNGGLRGYSYIMLIHNNGYATVYGHISKILVKSDEFVESGQMIAYSGGTPGTPGAGALTTGPHLHFEVRLNGIPIDPLGYL